MTDPQTTHFGYRDVPESDKARLVGEVFTSVARSYDLMNDLMSFGMHRLWKRLFVATSGVRAGDRVLDLAGGTGDIAALLLPKVGAEGSIVVGDINGDMLRVGTVLVLLSRHTPSSGHESLRRHETLKPPSLAPASFGPAVLVDQEMQRLYALATRAGKAFSDLADLTIGAALDAVQEEFALRHGRVPGGRVVHRSRG